MIDLDKIQKEREAAKAKLEKLDAELESARTEKLKTLPQQVGLHSVDALIEALAAQASPRLKGRLKPVFAKDSEDDTAKPAKRGKRRRTRLDDATKSKIIDALSAKDRTAAQIAKDFNVSPATVNNIKKEAGLTKTRK